MRFGKTRLLKALMAMATAFRPVFATASAAALPHTIVSARSAYMLQPRTQAGMALSGSKSFSAWMTPLSRGKPLYATVRAWRPLDLAASSQAFAKSASMRKR